MERNDALHQGAFARYLTKHAIELAILLEDALSNGLDPLARETWQPIAFLRQLMLANSYSYLPVFRNDNQWWIVSDAAIAAYLGRTEKTNGQDVVQGLSRKLWLAQKDLSVSCLR